MARVFSNQEAGDGKVEVELTISALALFGLCDSAILSSVGAGGGLAASLLSDIGTRLRRRFGRLLYRWGLRDRSEDRRFLEEDRWRRNLDLHMMQRGICECSTRMTKEEGSRPVVVAGCVVLIVFGLRQTSSSCGEWYMLCSQSSAGDAEVNYPRRYLCQGPGSLGYRCWWRLGRGGLHFQVGSHPIRSSPGHDWLERSPERPPSGPNWASRACHFFRWTAGPADLSQHANDARRTAWA
jgi:hypothetical protein